ncbi:MAG: polyribonucleotide nucleotidyltransferase [Patescibacteria group bacterium]|jgi:polyribonucleotide nucleotidyltransferase
MFANKKFQTEFGGRTLTVELGKLAHQCNGAALVSYGETVILATAVMGKEPRMGIDFFPLQIEMVEKMYAAGKIKGSKFVKRDGRPTDNAILDGRMIDRGIRPLFNQEMRHEVQVATTVLSYDEENSVDVLAITAGSLALHISDIPWRGPLVGVCVGRVNGELILNPTESQLKESDFKLIFSAGYDKVLMIDAEGKEITEADMAQAIGFGLKAIKPLLDFIESIRKEIGLGKKDEAKLVEAAWANMEITLAEKKATFEEAKKFFAPQLDKYLFNQPKGTKRERKAVAEKLLDLFIEQLKAKNTHEEIIAYIKENFDLYLEDEVTKAILDKDLRIDGRGVTDIRPLSANVGILPRTHGTGLFQRGETQILSVVTLGAPGDAQILDEMTQDDTKKTYIHHYSSAPFAYGEPGRFGSPGRREIGHGALAEKALIPVLPDKEKFPYTILVVSEVMGSNGSSSMASTCGSTLALMDAGVPIKKPVAGIAMGLASDGQRNKVITDLQDFEDGPGGMDFKVTGTADGITAIQMDTKTDGLSIDLCVESLARAKEARLKILDVITNAIPEPRSDLSPYAPRIICLRIDPEKIGAVIGAGGKVINKIIEECGVQIDIDDDGIVAITGVGQESMDKAVAWIEGLVKEVEPGEIYTGKVVRLMDFGAFVEILPGQDGLVHISEFSNNRVDKITDVANIGDELTVKVIEIDDKGRINLSVKQADPNYNPAEDMRRPRSDSGDRPGGRGGFNRDRDRGGFGGQRRRDNDRGGFRR